MDDGSRIRLVLLSSLGCRERKGRWLVGPVCSWPRWPRQCCYGAVLYSVVQLGCSSRGGFSLGGPAVIEGVGAGTTGDAFRVTPYSARRG